MKQVLHVIDTWGIGGAETVCIEIASRLDRSRFESRGIAIREGWVFDAMRDNGLRPRIVRTGSGAIDLRFLWGLIRECLRERPRVIQSHLQTANLYCSLVGKVLSIPVVTTFHGAIDFAPEGRFATVKARATSAFAARTVFVSDSLRRQFLETHGVSGRRAAVIHNGIDAEHYRPRRDVQLRQRLALAPDVLLVAAVGNIREAKAYDDLLRVAACARDAGAAMHFVVAGWERQPLYTELLHLRSELRLDSVVTFLGTVADTRTVFDAADIYLSTSATEGFSLTVVQAMASGLPVVVTRSGGPQEIVTDGIDGLLHEVGDVASLCATLLRLAHDEPERERLGHAARLTVLERFTTERMVRGYEELYDEILST